MGLRLLSVKGIAGGLVVLIAAIIFQFLLLSTPDSAAFLSRSFSTPYFWPLRLMLAVLPQAFNVSPKSDENVSLSGQLILITGSNRGIGLETAKGLARLGADLIITARSEESGKRAANEILSDLQMREKKNVTITNLQLDLSDLSSVINLVSEVKKLFPQRRLDQLIQNAGYWPSEFSVSKQGHEIAFATNVLGPHLLLRKLLKDDVLKQDAKVIVLHGDLYISLQWTQNEDCTVDFKYSGKSGTQTAYCRSKIGVHWLFNQTLEKFPKLHMNLVHPGVMDNGLVPNGNDIPKLFLISNEQGAQTTLICATSETVNGAYYHNTLGRMILRHDDPVNNPEKQRAMWTLVEGLLAKYL